MYTQQELAAIDRSYFAVIVADEYDVTLMSLNTRHMWQLHNVELPDGEVTVLFHKHHASDPYHLQGKRKTSPRSSAETVFDCVRISVCSRSRRRGACRRQPSDSG